MESAAENENSGRAQKHRPARIARDTALTIFPYTDGKLGKPLQVRLKNLSWLGLGIIHTWPMKVGAEFAIQLPLAGGRGLKTLVYEVVHCEMLPDGKSSIGAELAAVVKTSQAAA
jgi:hypothetical protein